MATFLRARNTLTIGAAGPQCLLTTYWDSTGAAVGALATEAMARVRAAWAALANAIPSSSTLSFDPLLDEIEESNGNIVGQVAGTLPAAVTFTNANDPLPYQTQALVRLDTGVYIGGRRLKGRIFIPGASEDRNTAGAPIAAYLTQLNSFATALGTTVVTPMNQRVWHRPVNGFGGLSQPVISRTVSGQWAVLKSRRS